MTTDTVWTPRLERAEAGPQYRALVDALEKDIAEGRVQPGARLPARRTLASDLGLSLGTVTRAYEEMERRGLVEGQVGRGTFVRARPGDSESGAVSGTRAILADLSLNIAPSTGDTELLRTTLHWLADSAELDDAMRYLPHTGEAAPRATLARGFARLRGCDFGPAETVLTHGAQHAIALVSELFTRPDGDAPGIAPMLSESVSYTGIIALARHRGIPLKGVGLDEEGMRPEDLAARAKETGAKLVYLTPTLQSPTAATMSMERRAAIVEVARAQDLYLIEDDCYGFLDPDGPPPLQTLAPERVFYVTSFAKCFSPALRLGMVLVPPRFAGAIAVGLRASSWMASPLLARGMAHLCETGDLDAAISGKRSEAAARLSLACDLLNQPTPRGAAGFHLWLPMPDPQTALTFVGNAAARGVVLTAPDVVQVSADAPPGVRLCLGGPGDHTTLAAALKHLSEIYLPTTWRSVV